MGKAMLALVANPQDKAALGVVSQDKMLNSMLHTSCVGTMVNAGHALNALPQRATANINFRIFPGHKPAEIMAELGRAIGDPGVALWWVPKNGGDLRVLACDTYHRRECNLHAIALTLQNLRAIERYGTVNWR